MGARPLQRRTTLGSSAAGLSVFCFSLKMVSLIYFIVSEIYILIKFR